jgi:hypothetical protein
VGGAGVAVAVAAVAVGVGVGVAVEVWVAVGGTLAQASVRATNRATDDAPRHEK